ncbi:glutamate dehydrogenase/leucine dehydrogenase [Paraburkholderia sp. BL6669N2]|uniref:Glu/Leu/Phe/Val dehydrogenase dimerization domain-containing protein n=1 Tax=Paraburkholderia sp. BL6669N2 TaxID=1938807 RepID=UPI000E282E42|nr:Glu/Leu/Phe/Val dehydrogenase dimerization domain-containing protein [Paraburkholderia sp. BL6669N2]REG49572.1 glutamate dehydrogenase/leucine dehydrogenase [Paraburkholderia sp. BL6669N2]
MSQIHIPTDHEHVQVKPGRRTGLPVMIAVHSTVLGPAIGGLRIKHYEHASDGLTDCLRLSHAMTYKAAAIDNGTGGGKAVVPLPTGMTLSAPQRSALLLDIAEHIHSLDGAYLAGPDVGTGPEDMDFMYRRTRWTGGRSKAAGGAGGTTYGTFVGLLSAINTAVEVSLDRNSLSGLRFSIVGLGGIGASLAKTLKEQGAELIVSDIDPAKELLAKELGAQWLQPGEALLANCDVLVPCALGGVFTTENIGSLRCKVICGAANNQLAVDSVATTLLEREIVYVPDFIASAGGLMYASGVEVHNRTADAAEKHVRDGIAQNVHTVLQESRKLDIPTVEVALTIGQRRLDAAQARLA